MSVSLRRLIAHAGRQCPSAASVIHGGRRRSLPTSSSSFFHSGLSTRLAEILMNVPSMGDSITEGTISAWQKNVGDQINIDDVVVVIETDKVSVDIRASAAGILAEQYAGVDETVAVGAKLLKIDTTAAPGSIKPIHTSSITPAPAAAASAPAPAPTPGPPVTHTSSAAGAAIEGGGDEHHAHKPLIKFLGKRSLLSQKAASPITAAASSSPPPIRYEDIKGTPGAKVFLDLPVMYGRPKFSQKEIEAIETGGASL